MTESSSPTQTRRGETPPLPEPLPHPVVDNHCHLDMIEQLDVPTALGRAAAVGVTRVVQIGCDLPGARWAVQAAAEHDRLVAGVALHPNEAPGLADTGQLGQALAEIEELASAGDPVRAVGETGLDYYRTGPEGRPAQQESFRAHIDLANRLGLTLVVHDRDAHADVLTLLDQVGVPDRVVMHCFSGDADFARACAERGCYLSFAGTVTFRNAPDLRRALAVAPRDRLLVETDAPFLTPEPFRGRPNASYLVPHTVRAMAATLDADLGRLCEDLWANTARAYGGAW